MELNQQIAQKVIETVDAGLSSGLGRRKPGEMCVEAAVCFAMGLPHGDNPPCVGRAVRSYKIRLNDANWSSKAARAKGMRRVAVAQLGSDQIDQKEFATQVAIEGIKQILPIAIRAVAKLIPSHAEALELAALGCEAVVTLAQARDRARSSRDVINTARSDAADADAAYASDAAAYASDAAYAYASAADAASAAYASDAASDAAADAADAAGSEARDSILAKAADIAVSVLCKLGAAGCQWLFLCDEAA